MNSSHNILKRLNLNLLYPLYAILNSRSLTEAGRNVYLTQSAMSVALRKLRSHFNDELVRHVGGEQVLTPLAIALKPKLHAVLCDASALFNLAVGFDPATERRTIRIAAPEFLEVVFVSQLVLLLRTEAPGIDVRFLRYDPSALQRTLDGGVDLLIGPGPLADPRLESAYLFDDGLACLVWKDNRQAGDSISVDAFLAANHVAIHDDGEWERMIGPDHVALMAGRRIVATTHLFSTLAHLVIGTDLIAMMSMWLAQHYASMMPVRVVGQPFGRQKVPIMAYWERHRSGDPVVEWLLAQMVGLSTRLPMRAAVPSALHERAE